MKGAVYLGLFGFSAALIYVVLYQLPLSLFTYHPLLILVALVLITEGIADIASQKIVSEKSKSVHGILQGLGFTAMTFGFSVIYYNKDLNSKPHFTTVHGKLGSITFTYMLMQLFMGTLVLYVPALFGGIQRAKSMYTYHRISGYVLLVLLWVTALYGVQTPFVMTNSGLLGYVYYLSAVCVSVGLLSLLQPRRLRPRK